MEDSSKTQAADHSRPTSAAVMEELNYTSTHPLGHTGPLTGSIYFFIFIFFIFLFIYLFFFSSSPGYISNRGSTAGCNTSCV